MRESNLITIYTGIQNKEVHGEVRPVKCFKTVDLDAVLDFDRLMNDVMAEDVKRNKKAKKEIELYRKQKKLAEGTGREHFGD